MAHQRFPDQPKQTSNATTPSPPYGGLAEPCSAIDHQGEDLLGVVADPMPFAFSLSSASRNFSMQHVFPDDINTSMFSSTHVDDPAQQDEGHILLTTPEGVNQQFLHDITAQISNPGTVQTYHQPQFSTIRKPTGPWDPVGATGVPTPTRTRLPNRRTPRQLSSQYQTQTSFGSPSTRTISDSASFTFSTNRGHRDGPFPDNETVDTTESLQERFACGFDLKSGYIPSIAAENDPYQDISSHDQATDMQQEPTPTNQVQSSHDGVLRCPVDPKCKKKTFSTNSQLTKHLATHERRHVCDIPGCTRRIGFSTVNDLDRHKKTVHKLAGLGRYYRCFGKNCSKANKNWPRLDNFKIHLHKLHPNESVGELVKQSDAWFDARFEEAARTQANVIDRRRNSLQPFGLVQNAASSSVDQSHQEQYTIQPHQGLTTVSPFQLDQRNLDPRYLTPGPWTPYGSQGLNRSSSLIPSPLHSHGAQRHAGSAQGRASVSGQNPVTVQRMADISSQQPERRQQSQMRPGNLDRQTYGQPRSAERPNAPQPAQSTMFDVQSVFRAYIPMPSGTSMLSIFGSGHLDIQKARTAPDPDLNTLTQRIVDVDSTIPQPSYGTPASAGHTLLAIGSGHDLNTNRITEETGDTFHVGSSEPSPTAPHDPQDDQVQSILQSVLSRRAGVANGAIDYSQDLLAELVKEALRSVDRDARGPNSPAAAAPNKIEPVDNYRPTDTDGRRMIDGKWWYVCQGPHCDKKTLRQSEMNKHLRRHTKPYGCTFDDCYKKFGSKNDLKRHEHSQHEQPECWRCEESLDESGPCYSLYRQRQKYIDHLKDDHELPGMSIKENLKKYKISRMHQINYWCGFCQKILTMEKKGISGDNERFDHIVNHFLVEKKHIDDWWPAEGKKTKGEIKAEKGLEKEHVAPDSEANEPGQVDAEMEDAESEDEDEEDGEDDESSPTDSTPSPIEMEQHVSPMTPQQGHLPQQYHHQPQQTTLLSPPPTGKTKKRHSFSEINSGFFTDDSRSNHSSGSRVRRRAEFAQCCECQSGAMMPVPPQLLANTTKCLECQHKFCQKKDGCKYS